MVGYFCSMSFHFSKVLFSFPFLARVLAVSSIEYYHCKKRLFSFQPFRMSSTCSAAGVGEDMYHMRLNQISGEPNKANDIFVCGQKQNCKEHIIFFGGDVQDYSENMERHRDNKRYVNWNTEATAKVIQQKFPSSLVFVIKPTKMHLLTFAVYSNFFQSNDFGNPMHSENFGAIRHLSSIYTSALKTVYSDDEDTNFDVPLRLIGFSKGCTVLNQIVYELHLADDDTVVKDFLKKITAFYWLDGGHSGGASGNTWVTDDSVLRHLASLNCDIFIHVSPYQVRDPMRKWIGQQESKFHKKLLALKAKVYEKEHFTQEPASIENHFRVLQDTMADFVSSTTESPEREASEILVLFAYPEFVNDFSIINKDTISQVKNIDTLVSLLTSKNDNENEWPEENHIKKLKLWWQLVRSEESKISSLSSKVVIPMLEYFCRVIALSGKNLTFKKLTFEVIAHLLESRTEREQVIDMNKEWESYEWVLEPLPEEVLWDHETVAALLNYFYHLLGSAKKDINACVLMKISLQLAEKLKDCNDMKMYITFLNCFECLLCPKRLKEEAFVILAVSCSFMMTNTLSILSKENKTLVNQMVLLFQNESRKLHCDVLNMLLNLYPLLFEQIVTYEMASLFFEHMMSSFVLLFHTSIEHVLPSFTSKLIRLWQKLCQCIKKIYGQTCSAKDLTVFFPLMELALQHSNRIIKKLSKKLWESTFSHLPESLYPESLKLILAKTGSSTSHSQNSDHSQNSAQGNEHSQCAETKSNEQTLISSELKTSLLEEMNRKTCKVSVYKLPVMLQAKANESNTLVQEDFLLPISEIETETVVEAIMKKLVEEKTSNKGQNETNQAEAKFPPYKVKVEEKFKIKTDISEVEAKSSNPEQKNKGEKIHKIKTEMSQAEAKFCIPNSKVKAVDNDKLKKEYLTCLNVVTSTEQILEFLTMDQLLELNANLNTLVSKSIKVILEKKKREF